MLHDYGHCCVIHTIFMLYNSKCSFHQPFLRYGDYYKSDLLLMDSRRALLWVSNHCHEALELPEIWTLHHRAVGSHFTYTEQSTTLAAVY